MSKWTEPLVRKNEICPVTFFGGRGVWVKGIGASSHMYQPDRFTIKQFTISTIGLPPPPHCYLLLNRLNQYLITKFLAFNTSASTEEYFLCLTHLCSQKVPHKLRATVRQVFIVWLVPTPPDPVLIVTELVTARETVSTSEVIQLAL